MAPQPATLEERLRAGDYALFHLRGHAISINEFHAMVIGGTFAFFYGERGLLWRTLLHEPHYALGAAVIGYLLGRGISPRGG